MFFLKGKAERKNIWHIVLFTLTFPRFYGVLISRSLENSKRRCHSRMSMAFFVPYGVIYSRTYWSRNWVAVMPQPVPFAVSSSSAFFAFRPTRIERQKEFPMTAAEMLASPTVTLVDNRPATTSLDIAEHFGKRHDHVCRDIRRICAETPEKFLAPNFGEMSRTVKIGNGAEREETYFTVYFDGFILLVMGYTGKKALGMKLAYI